MTGKPILFSTPMVRAILDGRKTQTRRVIDPQPVDCDQCLLAADNSYDYKFFSSPWRNIRVAKTAWIAPKYQPGDLLWVRETWCYEYNNDASMTGNIIYKADGGYVVHVDGDDRSPWKSPMFMPKKAARIWLRVTDVRAERLQEISEADAKAEGLCAWIGGAKETRYGIQIGDVWESDPRKTYARLWDSLNAKRWYSWESNPWVWVYTFERTEK